MNKSIYFVGAGGIGMAALERYFLSKGYKVAGYDRTATDLTAAVSAEGAQITFTDSADEIPDYCRDKENTLVVYTPANHEACTSARFDNQRYKRSLLLRYSWQDNHFKHGGTHPPYFGNRLQCFPRWCASQL